MKEAIEKIVKALVDEAEAVEVSERKDGSAIVIVVRVAPSDMGKVIGREGRTIRAMRSLLFAASQKHRQRYALEMAE